jgi:hypothetical protein
MNLARNGVIGRPLCRPRLHRSRLRAAASFNLRSDRYGQDVPRPEGEGAAEYDSFVLIQDAHYVTLIYIQVTRALRHRASCEKMSKARRRCSDMTNLAEIQEAIEKLAPEERAALREWLDESDPDTIGVIRERVRQIRAGEATLVDGNQVQQEMRQLARQIANQ